VAPAGVPEAVLAKSSGAIAKIVKDPQFGEQLKGLGLEIVGSERAELDKFRAGQRKSITEIVKISGVDVK
jgi:tripartite-type tricarboxylate transporter receptor subunit TctC